VLAGAVTAAAEIVPGNLAPPPLPKVVGEGSVGCAKIAAYTVGEVSTPVAKIPGMSALVPEIVTFVEPVSVNVPNGAVIAAALTVGVVITPAPKVPGEETAVEVIVTVPGDERPKPAGEVKLAEVITPEVKVPGEETAVEVIVTVPGDERPKPAGEVKLTEVIAPELKDPAEVTGVEVMVSPPGAVMTPVEAGEDSKKVVPAVNDNAAGEV